jgi:hypothetical protein
MFLLYYSVGCNIHRTVFSWVLCQRIAHYNMQWCARSPHLLCQRQLHWLNKSRATISKRLHPESIASRCSSCWRWGNIQIQWVTRCCKSGCLFGLLKIKLFLVFQIAQINAHTPTRIWIRSSLGIPLSQFPKRLVTFLCVSNPRVI